MSQPWETFFSPASPLVMGILNVSPDSFFPASRTSSQQPVELLAKVDAMLSVGAQILDIGAESSRPGAVPVSEQEELDRLIPAIDLVRSISSIPLSIDTRRASVANAALENGADIINDISAGREDNDSMLTLAAKRQCPLILMHMQGQPATMQLEPRYQDVVTEVIAWLGQRIQLARTKGVRHIIADPGIGFGKTLEHNLSLLAACGEMGRKLAYPILIGHSRKQFIGQVLGDGGPEGKLRPAEGRLAGGLGVVAWAMLQNVGIIRTHDVAETADLIKMIAAIRSKAEPRHV